MIKYGKEEVFRKMMDRFVSEVFRHPRIFFLSVLLFDAFKMHPQPFFKTSLFLSSKMKLKLHDLIYLACLYGQKGIVDDIIQHQQRRGEFDVSEKCLYYWFSLR